MTFSPKGSLANSLMKFARKVGTVGATFAYLGKGDGTGTITNPNSAQPRSVFYHRDSESGREIGIAILAAQSGIPFEDNPALEFMPIQLGYLPNLPDLYVIGIGGREGAQFIGDYTPMEAKVMSMAYSYARDTRDGRVEMTQPATKGVLATGSFFYSNLGDTNGKNLQYQPDTLYDFTSDIAALTSGQHQIALLCLDYSTGNLARILTTAATAGSGSVPSRSEFSFTNLTGLTITNTYIPLGTIYLYYNQSTIIEDDILRNLDPRLWFTGISADPVMTGSTGSVAGKMGLVPAPAIADNVKFLRGDGTWVASSGVVLPNICGGRLTLSSTLALPSSDITAATTLYDLPWAGSHVSLYSGSGSTWTDYAIPSGGVSISLSGLLADSLYDVFLYDSGGGTLALDLTAWNRPSNGTVTGATNATPIVITTSAAHGLSTDQLVTISAVGGNTAANGTFRITVVTTTTFSLQNYTGTNITGNGAYTSGGVWVRADQPNGTRATALALQDGVYCKTGSLTRRYRGTLRITDTIGQCEDSKANRFLWNMDNRESRIIQKLHLTVHTYTTAAWRFWENDASFRMCFVAGIANGLQYGGTSSIVASVTGGDVYVGAMIDWTSGSPNAGARNGNTNTIIASFTTVDPYAEGYHTIPEVEYVTSGTGTISSGTLYGTIFN